MDAPGRAQTRVGAHPALSPVCSSARTRTPVSKARLSCARLLAQAALTSPPSRPARPLDLTLHSGQLQLQTLNLKHGRTRFLPTGFDYQLGEQVLEGIIDIKARAIVVPNLRAAP